MPSEMGNGDDHAASAAGRDQTVVNIFIDLQTKRVARADSVGPQNTRIDQAAGKAKRRCKLGRAGDVVIHGHDVSIAHFLDRAVKYLVLGWPRSRETTRGEDARRYTDRDPARAF